MIEKRGVVEKGWTKPEEDVDEKRAALTELELEDHAILRLAKKVMATHCGKCTCSEQKDEAD